MKSFAGTEFITSWQFLYTINTLKNPKHQAMFFEQLLEEYHHAEMFKKLASEKSGKRIDLDQVEITKLYSGDENLWKLILYSQVGEESAVDRFAALQKHINDDDIKVAIKEILKDETHHSRNIHQILLEMGLNQDDLGKFEKIIKQEIFWEHWKKTGKRITGFFTSAVISAMYYGFGFLLVLPSRRRLEKTQFYKKDKMETAL